MAQTETGVNYSIMADNRFFGSYDVIAVDTEPSMLVNTVDEAGLKIKEVGLMTHPLHTYVMRWVRLKKKDFPMFKECLKKTHNNLLITGSTNYRRFCETTFCEFLEQVDKNEEKGGKQA